MAEVPLGGDDIFYLGVSLYAPKIDTEIRAKVTNNIMVEDYRRTMTEC